MIYLKVQMVLSIACMNERLDFGKFVLIQKEKGVDADKTFFWFPLFSVFLLKGFHGREEQM
jgi:hypothetical protein